MSSVKYKNIYTVIQNVYILSCQYLQWEWRTEGEEVLWRRLPCCPDLMKKKMRQIFNIRQDKNNLVMKKNRFTMQMWGFYFISIHFLCTTYFCVQSTHLCTYILPYVRMYVFMIDVLCCPVLSFYRTEEPSTKA